MNRFELKLIRFVASAFAAVLLLSWTDRALAQQTAPPSPTPQLTFADQGWSAADREAFYTTSQGSRMIPYDWFKALRRLDVDEPFGADQLQRYGYLPNASSSKNLPIGFVVDERPSPPQLGMTCAACHTGQLEYQKDGAIHQLRLDGAPANADFQLFMTDLLAATRATSRDAARFDTFAKTVLGPKFSAAKAATLKKDFDAWVAQFGEFMDKSLPPTPWGPGRLDAFNMIFNRVAVRGLGLLQNFAIADAPVSYPFLWNISKQDHTQWNGIVESGLYIHALARNTGEMFGVFGDFSPIRLPRLPLLAPIILYDRNSADFSGLQALEEKIAVLKAPPWPRDIFPINDALATRGKPLFETNCGGCHGEHDSKIVPATWATPVQPVGTDAKMADNAAKRTVDSGRLEGALMPRPIGARLKNPAKAAEVLATSVVGSLFAGALKNESGIRDAIALDLAKVKKSAASRTKKANFLKENLSELFYVPPDAPKGAYEARVLHGIWATAPYLHNGSVPSLWELLTPPGQRKSSFMVGSRLFDPKNVGYATDQSPFKNGNFVTDPANANGNGNGGHTAGTNLGEDDRRAIIEYLKTL